MRKSILLLSSILLATLLTFGQRNKVYHSLEEALETPNKVYQLELTGTKKLPATISELRKLKQLTITDSHLRILPREIGDLKKLESLTIHPASYENSQLTLPKEIEQLSNLKKLNLSGNKLDRFPIEITKLRLSELDLSLTNLQTIPDEIGQMIFFITLNLSNNNISTLPESFNQLFFSSLNLRKNQLSTFPENLFNNVSQKLDLSDNPINSFPYDMPITDNQVLSVDISNTKLTDVQRDLLKKSFPNTYIKHHDDGNW